MDLLMSSRVLLAEEAYEIGLVDRLCDPDQLLEETRAYAADMAANCSPRSLASIKQQVLGDWERGAEDSRMAALRLFTDMRSCPDFAEGVRSFTEKRSPSFEGLSFEVTAERIDPLSYKW
jgi:enoyl-CoA hydratase/carnithine racemase